jgi:hypothetical protein
MLQTILIPRSKFSLSDAVVWMKEHNYEHHKVDITGNFYRFRQVAPEHYGRYYTVKLPNGIELVHQVHF